MSCRRPRAWAGRIRRRVRRTRPTLPRCAVSALLDCTKVHVASAVSCFAVAALLTLQHPSSSTTRAPCRDTSVPFLQFWAGVAGTKTVGGYWAEIAFQLLKPDDAASLRKSARLLALLFTTAYDNNIAVRETSAAESIIRPVLADSWALHRCHGG